MNVFRAAVLATLAGRTDDVVAVVEWDAVGVDRNWTGALFRSIVEVHGVNGCSVTGPVCRLTDLNGQQAVEPVWSRQRSYTRNRYSLLTPTSA